MSGGNLRMTVEDETDLVALAGAVLSRRAPAPPP